MATTSRVGPRVVRVAAVADIPYLLDNAQIGIAGDLAAKRELWPVVVLDLRRCSSAPQKILGKVLTFDRFCQSAKTKLVVVTAESPLREAMRETKLDALLTVCDAETLRARFGVEVAVLDAAPPEPKITITEEECRRMREDGYTLSDAIRDIEPLLRSE